MNETSLVHVAVNSWIRSIRVYDKNLHLKTGRQTASLI